MQSFVCTTFVEEHSIQHKSLVSRPNFILVLYCYSNLVIHSIVGDVLIVFKLLNSICHWYLWIAFLINYKFFESSTFDLDNVSCYMVKMASKVECAIINLCCLKLQIICPMMFPCCSYSHFIVHHYQSTNMN